MKKTKLLKLILAMLLVLMVGGCVPQKEEVIEAPKEETVESTKPEPVPEKPVAPPVETPKQKESIPIPELVPELKSNQTEEKQATLELLQTTFEGDFVITYDEYNNIYLFTANNSLLVDEISMILMGQVTPDVWNEMAEEFRLMSETISKSINDPSVGFIILNPFEPDLALLMVQNGTILYNITEDQEGVY